MERCAPRSPGATVGSGGLAIAPWTGKRISIDEFGAGYTSRAVLPDLSLDELKVDQRFFLRSLVAQADDAIVQTVRGLAGRLGLDCVAEAVDTEEHFERMSSYWFDRLQGDFLAKPLCEEDLIALVGRAQERVAALIP